MGVARRTLSDLGSLYVPSKGRPYASRLEFVAFPR